MDKIRYIPVLFIVVFVLGGYLVRFDGEAAYTNPIVLTTALIGAVLGACYSFNRRRKNNKK